MRKCDDCKIILEDTAGFCPKCGREIGAEQAGPEMDVDSASLLASATLHRVRGDLDAAAADASKAVQEAPKDPEAAAMLASIHEDRGDLAEAAVWYRIASDLAPSNTMHKAQLDRITRLVPGAGAQKPPKPRTVDNPLFWGIGVGAVVLVIALLFMLLRGGSSKDAARTVSDNRTPVTMVTPETSPRGGAVPVRPNSGAPLEGSQTATQARGGARTPAEASIKAEAGQSELVAQAGAVVDDIIADPRQGIAVVTYSVPGGGILTKDRILAVSEGIARSVFVANTNVQFVTARCLVLSGGSGGAQIAFVGDVARQTIESLPDNPAPEQLANVFTNQWWNPLVR